MRFSALALIAISLAVVRPASGEILYTVTDLGTLGGTESFGMDINHDGHVAGRARNSAGEFRAFLYDGAMHDLGALGGTSAYGEGIF